jgi:F-type H+-transporting ATPase subunit delta
VSERADVYASALLGIAKAEGATSSVEDELFRFARALEGADQLREALTDAHMPPAKRQAIVEELLGGKSSDITISLVSFIVGAGRSRDLPAIVDRFLALAAEEREHAIAEVRSAIPLDDATRQRLAEALGRATGKRVDVKVVVDPSVMGGVVARIGDTIIDGSVRHRLDQLKEKLPS